ncbi:MAG TPA: multiheme c-type cytochrome [Candidatus Angelobacter sp.]|nr:multiheme c-type cytochrome [Candidatus Angelobacter sp.]
MRFKDANHLFRLAAVFAAGFLIFLLVRGFLVPRSFGQYGHYRGDALAEIKKQPPNYAGHEACEACHSDVLEQKVKGKHVRVNCEACHGPLARHAEDPGGTTPEKLDTAKLCVRCHEANAGKPKWFPQVVSVDHSAGLACGECHKPHTPAIVAEEKAASAAGPSKASKGAKK